MRKFFVALENEEVPPPAEVDADAVMETKADVEEAHDEVTAAVDEVEEIHEIVEKGMEAVDTLKGVADVMEEQVDKGEGMSEDAAKMAEVTIESIRVSLGLPKSMARLPSLESFKSPRSRVEATKIALENAVWDSIKKIFAKIVEYCKTVWDTLKTLYASLTKNYGKLKEHLEVLKTKVEASSGEVTEANLAKGNLAAFFSIDKKADAKTAETFLGVAEVSDKLVDGVTGFVKERADVEKLAEMTAEKAKEKVQEYTAELMKIFQSSSLKMAQKGDVATIGPLPGGYFIELKKTEDGLDVEFVQKKEDAAKEIAALSKEESLKLLDIAIKECGEGEALKKRAAASEAAMNTIIKASEALAKQLEKYAEKDGKETAEKAREASGSVNSFLRAVSKVSSKLPALHFSTVKYTGDYVEASLSNFKKAEKPAKEEKK